MLTIQIPTTELASMIVEAVKQELHKLHEQQPPEPTQDELISIADVSKLLKVSKVTIFDWKKKGLIPFYRMSGRVYFKKSEVLEALKKIERKQI